MKRREPDEQAEVDALYRSIERIRRPGQRKAMVWFSAWVVGDDLTMGGLARATVAPLLALWSYATEETDR